MLRFSAPLERTAAQVGRIHQTELTCSTIAGCIHYAGTALDQRVAPHPLPSSIFSFCPPPLVASKAEG